MGFSTDDEGPALHDAAVETASAAGLLAIPDVLQRADRPSQPVESRWTRELNPNDGYGIDAIVGSPVQNDASGAVNLAVPIRPRSGTCLSQNERASNLRARPDMPVGALSAVPSR